MQRLWDFVLIALSSNERSWRLRAFDSRHEISNNVVYSDEPVQSPFKLRDSKYSVSS